MIEFLINHAKGNKISFHMPGHKGSGIYKMLGYEDFLSNIMDCDITEIPGADNLYHPESIIKELEDRYANLYGAKKSFLLVNGTTAGVLAVVMASVKPKKKLLMSRGSHKSTYSGVALGDIKPIYIQPEICEPWGIIGEITAESVAKAFEENEDIGAVILPSPNYYGICSDIKAIAEEIHKRDGILIVDQAHGAHLKFFHKFGFGKDMPLAAEDCDADIIINSTHKTLASFTQSAVMNVMTDRVDIHNLFEKLQLVQSTSPSYLLMGSLAINCEIIENHGKELFEKWKTNIEEFYKKAKKIEGLDLVTSKNLDATKININFSKKGISGDEIEKTLMKNNIIPELVTGDIVMAMTGIGNKDEDYEALLDVLMGLADIADRRCDRQINGFTIPTPGILREHSDKKEEIILEAAVGKISGGSITPYPPGIPFACPGEELTEEIVKSLLNLKRENKIIQGISGKGTIHIYKESE